MFKRLMALVVALVLMLPAMAIAETKNLSKNGSMVVGSEGDEVKAAQELLITYGYLTGTASGVYDKATEEAVKAFQQRNNLYPDGKIGKYTLTVLKSGNVVKKNDPDSGIDAGKRQ